MDYDYLKHLVSCLKDGILIKPHADLSSLECLQAADDNESLLSLAAATVVKMQKTLEETVDGLESILQTNVKTSSDLGVEQIERVATLADLLDDSEDPVLQKYASVLDQILLTIGAPKGAVEAFKQAEDKEIEKLREKYRTQALENSYKKPSEKLDEKIKAADQVKAIKDSIKQYRPLEAPLSTRTCPEHPGTPLQRVGDAAYQCFLDKKLYDFKSGYTSLKGNKVPGGDVAQQSQFLGDRAPDHMSFDTRESKLNS